MRSALLALLFQLGAATHAQYESPADPGTLPRWMQEVAFSAKPVRYTLPKREPLHTNAFTGTWSVQKQGSRRFDFWSDKHRVVIQDIDQQGKQRRMYFIDLAANIRMEAATDNGRTHFMVEDLHMPNVGYFRTIWSDSVRATGRAANLLGARCEEFLGTDGNKDTTYYWRTDQHPKLFADMQVWAPWLCREGELEFLTALCSRTVGPSMRAAWTKRRYSTGAGSIDMVAITPGAAPMPTIDGALGVVMEQRFLWNNNSGIGKLPAWMRAYVSDLKPDSLPAVYTPEPVKRDIPDNQFIGTLTAETPSMVIGLPDKKTGRDTTHRLAKYTYWADARRAVLIMDDPDDEGYLFYAVDLDADVVMATHKEMSGHVIPKLYISTLQNVGLKEFGDGLDVPMTATEHTRKMLGRTCTLYTTNERFLSHFWIPEKKVLNPVFDMRHWMVQRMGQKMKDILFFGVADKPMPMAVMGTHLTTYKQGKAKPPLADLRYYRVRDERLEERRSTAVEAIPDVRIRDVRDVEMPSMEVDPDQRGTDRVPDREIPLESRDMSRMVEASPDGGMLMPAHEPKPMMIDVDPEAVGIPPPPTPQAWPMQVGHTGREPTAGTGTGQPLEVALSPYLEETMALRTNRFIGSAVLDYTKTNASGRTEQWQVHYASDSTRILVLGISKTKDFNTYDRAYLIDRQTGSEQWFKLKADSTVTTQDATILDRHYRFSYAPAHPDSVISNTRKLLGRTCEKRLYEIPSTRRISWVDPSLPSLFQDVLGARKKWSSIEILLLGNMITSTTSGMPMEVDYTYHGGDHVVMKVIAINSGPVDPEVFGVRKESWTR
ncbi:MAG: hypothetical protein JST38_13895 [Bacteroidetes bacterium]|nr:hypothetical protein [Bacteroidota bacterium]MBS1941960.1 hypothetical protein [Bacteroidota bacterium]